MDDKYKKINELIIVLTSFHEAIKNETDVEKKKILKECVGDKVDEIIKAMEELTKSIEKMDKEGNGSGDIKESLNDAKKTLGEFKEVAKQLIDDRNKADLAQQYDNAAKQALGDFVKKGFKVNYKRYYYKVLPYAEYFDSKIPWFSEKWDRLRYDFKGLKAIAGVANSIFNKQTAPEKTSTKTSDE